MAVVAPATDPDPIPVNPLRALVSPYLWLATVHLVTDLWIAAAVGIAVLLAAGSVHRLVLIGIPVLLLTVRLAIPLSALERGRYRLTLGMAIGTVRLPVREGSWDQWARNLGRALWRPLAYLVLLPPLSLVNLAGVLLAWSVPPALILLPVYYPGFTERDTSLAGLDVGNDVSGWVVRCAALVFLLLVSPLLVRGLSRADAAFARALLGPSRTGQLTERVGQLETSRRRVVDSVEDERRRIERDLHDGAQQRLVSLAMNLGRATSRLPGDFDPATRGLIDAARHEATLAITELRELTRGLHPPVLTDRGLDAALSSVAARAPVPVRIDVQAEPRPSATVEAIAYFVVIEALTNVAKHAQATHAWVVIRHEGHLLRVTVGDDGVGGADPARGSGLTGLADRVCGIDGRLDVVSPRGGPTVLTMELPCGS
ncbi:MAG: sensor histidine kinase [Pseudonocardiales bacterium]|nr:MAG: sensor histidine kinase [Pseudonocardiales bacterium]